MNKIYTLLFLGLISFNFVKGQDEDKIVSIGILPVTSIPSYGEQYTEYIRAQITTAFTSKSRFTIVDRMRLDAIYKEKNLQMRSDFIDGVIVDQGKSIGAQYLANCSLNEIKYVNTTSTQTDWATLKSYTRLDLQLTINLNIQLIEVSTGAIKSTKNISHSSTYAGSATARPAPENCVIPTIESIGLKFRIWANELFPVEMKIIQVESSDKKGIPKTVLVTGGAEMDMQNSSSFFINTSSELEVFEPRIIEVDGRAIERPLVIGKVSVVKVEGELAVCKIQSGNEAILQAINADKPLYLRIKQY